MAQKKWDAEKQNQLRARKLDQLSPGARAQAEKHVAAIQEALDCTTGVHSAGFKSWLTAQDAGVKADFDRYFGDFVDPVEVAARPPTERETIDNFLREFPRPTGKQIVDALKRKSESSQRYLITHVLSNFSNSELGKIDDLARTVQNDFGLRRIVAERLLHHAI